MQVILVGYLIAIILLALGVIIITSGWTTLQQASVFDEKNLLLLIQIAMTLVGALAAAIITATVGRSSEYLRSRLSQSVADSTERLKADLTKSVNETTERLKSDLTTSVNASTERLKAELTKSGDVFRAELNQLAPRRHAAYHALWAALAQYFRALQEFEAGIFDEVALTSAEKACEDASGQSLLVDQVDYETFHNFWQEMTRVYEIGQDKRQTANGLQTLWRNEARSLGDLYHTVRNTFADRLRS
jgi:hypothetical protein